MFFSLINKIRFILHNKSLFITNKNSENTILVEYYDHKPTLVAYSYFANVIARKYNLKIVGYFPNFLNISKYLIDIIKKKIFLGNHQIYRSFGATDIVRPYKKFFKKKKFLLEFSRKKREITSKKKLLDLKIDKIPIGDLIYDEYLRRFNETTIDIKSKKFLNFLQDTIELFYYWKDYILKNNVKAIIHSHTCYNLGLPGRIGIFLNCKVYNLGMIYAYRLSKKNLLRSSKFSKYPLVFNFLKSKIKKNLYLLAKKELNKKFSGRSDVMQIFNQRQDFKSFSKKNSINLKKNLNTKKNKILVAAPCFTDAPHSYGANLFNDFHEWMEFIGKISDKSDFEWLIKLHPAHYDRNYNAIKSFVARFSKLILLPKFVTHNQIIKEKISAVLTVYGSVAHEYPLFNIPVINSSINNPHIAYSFCYNPSSKKELKKLLLNVQKLKFSITKKQKKEIYEYYYTRLMSEYFFPNYKKIATKLKNQTDSSEFYIEWIQSLNKKLHLKIIEDCSKFINSGKFRMLSDNTSKYSKLII